MAKIDILIPYYNSANYILLTLESLIKQEFVDFNCFLVDDGSLDDSFDIVTGFIENNNLLNFSNHKRPDKYKPGGRGSKNFALDNTNSPFVVFLDSDDIIYPNFLSIRYKFITENSDIDAVISDFGWKTHIDKDFKIYCYDTAFANNIDKNNDLFWLDYQDIRFWINPSNPIWNRKSLYGELWDEELYIAEDYEFHGRLLLRGIKLLHVPIVTWNYSENIDSMMANCIDPNVLATQAIAKHKLLKNLLNQTSLNCELQIKKDLIWQIKILRRCFLEQRKSGCKLSKEFKLVIFGNIYTDLRYLKKSSLLIKLNLWLCEKLSFFNLGYRLYMFFVPKDILTFNKFKII